MQEYACFNLCFGRIKKLNSLKTRVEEGLEQFDDDYNLESIILDLKTR